MALVLGGFIFTDYAIPDKVKLGGQHQLKVHKLIGGSRVVDAMGPDDADIPWSGRFQGNGAVDKAKALDQLRISGAQVPLIINSEFYQVVVKSFEWDYEAAYQVVYRINCLVVSSGDGFGGFLSSLDSLIAGDIGVAAAIISDFVGE
jgi:hypothetical protein